MPSIEQIKRSLNAMGEEFQKKVKRLEDDPTTRYEDWQRLYAVASASQISIPKNHQNKNGWSNYLNIPSIHTATVNALWGAKDRAFKMLYREKKKSNKSSHGSSGRHERVIRSPSRGRSPLKVRISSGTSRKSNSRSRGRTKTVIKSKSPMQRPAMTIQQIKDALMGAGFEEEVIILANQVPKPKKVDWEKLYDSCMNQPIASRTRSKSREKTQNHVGTYEDMVKWFAKVKMDAMNDPDV